MLTGKSRNVSEIKAQNLCIATLLFIPVTNPALVAHWPFAVAAVDVQRRRRLIQAGNGVACTQLDDLIGDVPQLKSLQQVYVGRVPMLLKWKQAVESF